MIELKLKNLNNMIIYADDDDYFFNARLAIFDSSTEIINSLPIEDNNKLDFLKKLCEIETLNDLVSIGLCKSILWASDEYELYTKFKNLFWDKCKNDENIVKFSKDTVFNIINDYLYDRICNYFKNDEDETTIYFIQDYKQLFDSYLDFIIDNLSLKEEENKMNEKEKLQEKLKELRYDEFIHKMKDMWNDKDFEYADKLSKEIQDLENQIKELEKGEK